jgi:signal transduction histidine kinase
MAACMEVFMESTTRPASDMRRRREASDGFEDSATAALEDVVELAIAFCGTSSGFISLSDGPRQRVVAYRGDDAATFGRAHDTWFGAIHGIETTVIPVPDAAAIRFHAAAPLVLASSERVGAVCVVDECPRELTLPQRRALELLAQQAVHVLELSELRAADREVRARAEALEARIMEARAEEGRRVASELHATLGHELNGASLSLTASLANLTGPRKDLDAVRGVATMLQGAVGRCRERAQSGYPTDVATEGFAGALRRLSATVAREGGIKVHVHVASDSVEQLTASSVYHLYHIAVDAIVGAVRHSRGSMVVVSISADAGNIVLRVDDDGIGVTPEGARDGREFTGIESVAHMLGGNFRLRPRRPCGLSVQVRVPTAPRGGTPPAEPPAPPAPPDAAAAVPAPKTARRA